MTSAVVMPQLGEAVIEGTVARWLKEPGEQVELFEPLLEIETDKVTTEATAESAGVLLKVLVPEGETVEVGTILAIIGQPGEAIGDETDLQSLSIATEMPVEDETKAVKTPDSVPTAVPASPLPAGDGHAAPGAKEISKKTYRGRISPVVGRMAEEHGLDLNDISGTGRDGRITKKDVVAFLERQQSGLTSIKSSEPAASMPASKAPLQVVPGEILQLSSIRRSIAEHMVRSKRTSPHVTTVFEVDFSTAANHRKENKGRFSRDGVNLTFTAYIIAAAVQALKAHPIVNSSWTEGGIDVKKDINIGMAVAIEDGLIVPVIKNADSLSLLGLARTINDLSSRARLNKLSPDEVLGATFTLTNHGTSGSLFATPIINQPNCGILGIGKIEKRVKVINDAIAIRTMAYASLTFDHRILDGASADGFMQTLQSVIEGWE